MDQSEFRALLHRYQQGRCTPEEERLIEQWYAGLGAERDLDLTAEEKTDLAATVWQRITEQTGMGTPARPVAGSRSRRWPSVPLKWAAVAVLALGGGALATYVSKGPAPPTGPPVAAETTSWRVYTNASAYETRVALPDGSAVRLAPASTLKYRRTADGTRRVAYLTGAGSFAIFHDAQHPFSVYTDQVVSTVLGTSFRVRAYAGQPEVQVQVLTGAVRVSPREPSATGVVVRPNQQAVYSPARRQLRRELVAKPALLVPQSFVFDDRPVAEVLASLEKAYGVDIVYDAAALRSCTINLTLHDEPLFAKLDLLCETLGSTYEQTDGRIVFHAQPCPAD